MQKPVRVLLCDDQVIIRTRVREALAKAPGISVVGEAAGGDAGVKMALDLAPDIVLMDVSMPDMNGIEATRRIRSSAPGIRVLAVSSEERRETVEAMFAAGACGYLLKNADPDELIQAIHSVMDEGFFQNASLRGTPAPANGAEHEVRQLIANDFVTSVNAPRSAGSASSSAEYLSEKRLVVVSLTGTVTNADAKSLSEQAMRLLMDHEARLVLVDSREAVSEISYAVLYWLPRFYTLFGVPRSTRIAVVLPTVPYRVESFQFYALACRNAGYDVRLFEGRQAAEDWLLQPGRG